jgi:lipoprotein NlpI
VLRQIRERVAYIFPVSSPTSSIAPRNAGLGLRASEAGEDESAQVAAALDREQQGKVQTLSADIDSGRLQGKPLAEALVDRAVAYSNLDRAEQAVADLSRAIEVDPQGARAYIVRGEVYSIRGSEQKRALDDFARALQLDPKRDLYMSRGRAYFFEGNYRAAQADFKQAAEQNNNEEQLHALIWLYFATQRLGEDGRAVIAGVRSRANLSQWPGAAVMMLLGNATTEEMLSAAWSFERKTELLQRCEAYFFLGEYRLLSADADAARAAFNESFATGVKYYVEYAFSKLELARMGQSDAGKRAGK